MQLQKNIQVCEDEISAMKANLLSESSTRENVCYNLIKQNVYTANQTLMISPDVLARSKIEKY